MTIQNYTFFSPNGTEFPVSANADGKLYQILTGMELDGFRRRDWEQPIDTALNRQYVNTSLVVGGRYFELRATEPSNCSILYFRPTVAMYMYLFIIYSPRTADGHSLV